MARTMATVEDQKSVLETLERIKQGSSQEAEIDNIQRDLRWVFRKMYASLRADCRVEVERQSNMPTATTETTTQIAASGERFPSSTVTASGHGSPQVSASIPPVTSLKQARALVKSSRKSSTAALAHPSTLVSERGSREERIYETSSELQDKVPRRICTLGERSRELGKNLDEFLFDEASKYEDVTSYRAENSPSTAGRNSRHSFKSVNALLDLAYIIYQHTTRTSIKDGKPFQSHRGNTRITRKVLEEIHLDITNREEVTKWYLEFPCKKGSQLDEDNKRHQHLRAMLQEIERLFQHLYNERS